MQHLFDVDCAVEHGVPEAIVIKNLQFWLQKNLVNEYNFHNGRVWTYNTYEGLKQYFPYWSTKQIRTIMDRLIEKEIIVKDKLAEKKQERVNYYAFVDQEKYLDFKYVSDKVKAQMLPFAQTGRWICPNGQMDLPKRADGFAQTGECIYKDTDIKTDIKTYMRFGSFLSFQNENEVIDYTKVNAIMVIESFSEQWIISEKYLQSFLEKEMQLQYMGYRRNYEAKLPKGISEFCKRNNGSEFKGKKHLDNALKKFLETWNDATVSRETSNVSIPNPFKR